jgi:hypothetical protein
MLNHASNVQETERERIVNVQMDTTKIKKETVKNAVINVHLAKKTQKIAKYAAQIDKLLLFVHNNFVSKFLFFGLIRYLSN